MVIVFSILVAAAFVGTFFYTGQTWDAMNAAGVVCLVYVIVFLYRATRPPVSPGLRRWVLGVGAVVILGITIYWNIMYRMTNWQYDTLHTIHKVSFHGIAIDKLRTKGINVLSEYYRQGDPQKMSLGDVFRKGTPNVDKDSSLVEFDQDSKSKLFAASVSDSEVVLICQASIPIDGEDPKFKNFDGRVGMTQDRLRITKKGLVYEIQN